jgi:tetratricopeptide (TPR) repeat protein
LQPIWKAQVRERPERALKELPGDPLYVVERVTCLLRGSEVAATAGREQDAVARAEAAQDLVQLSSFHSDSLELDTLIVLARAYNSTGQRGKADEVYQRATARLELLGRDETLMAGSMFNNWGTMLNRAGRPLDAERALRRSIAISREGEGEDAVPVSTLANYGQALYELGRLDEAASYCERAYAKGKKAGDEIAVSQTLLHLARVYRAQGDLKRSDEKLAEVEPLLHHSVPAGHIAFAVLALDKALNAQARGDIGGAAALAAKTREMMEALAQKGRASADYQGKSLVFISGIELQAGRPDDALADANRGLPLLQKAALPGKASAEVGRAYLALGRAFQAQKKTEEAHAAFRSAAEQLGDAVGSDHPDSRAARQLAGSSLQ